MGFINLDELKKSSVYITPNFPVLQTRRYKFSLFKVAGYVSLYTFSIAVLIGLILIFTPAKKYLFFVENEVLNKQSERIDELESKVVQLTTELSDMVSTNKKLKLAMILGTTDSIDSSAAIYDSLRIEEDSLKGGNLFMITEMIIEKIFNTAPLDDSLIFVRPTTGFIIKSFDPDKGHMGTDFAAKTGSPVYAAAGGVVLFSDYTIGNGNTIIIQHKNDYLTVYKHLDSRIKSERDIVVQGELIAFSGNSGQNTSGPHLHFEIWKEGRVINPEKILINLKEK
ncbi:MAG: M23 family metallopeptidase [Melioribacteraceae bacterium]|nr:M23 family metallopeptidase [Melioribacteraceae bacterium]MCF8356705.1 M23 family metallopeptidase [Melioribacteraceae bacterium]MCF8393857.1 M23 family metallopeptidase [Melioribacteraceae bacterium]MCF8418230.1 M23 family metallopeptidase [Melioribacteraceae bacterium]